MEKLVQSCLDRDDNQRHVTVSTYANLWSMFQMEKHASTFYTHAMFEKFKEQLMNTAMHNIVSDESHDSYYVQNVCVGNLNRRYLVHASLEEQTIQLCLQKI